MKPVKFIFILFLFVVFFLGLYVYSTGKLHDLLFYENMENLEPDPTAAPTAAPIRDSANLPADTSSKCPNLLIKRGNSYLLYNTNLPQQAGNPMIFRSLDDYAVYFQQAQAQGSTCPMVYLQEETNVQGNQVLRSRPNPFQPGGFAAGEESSSRRKPVEYKDATRDHPPFNQGMYPGFDSQDQYVGIYTEIDAVHDSTKKMYNGLSPNAMDPNWGGVEFTQKLVDKGVYDENNVMILTA